jgi:hypothetical protein
MFYSSLKKKIDIQCLKTFSQNLYNVFLDADLCLENKVIKHESKHDYQLHFLKDPSIFSRFSLTFPNISAKLETGL